MNEPDYEEIDHTADAGIRLRAPAVELLFAGAAEAMFHLILPWRETGADKISFSHRISVQADSRSSLLREWLAELLYIHCTKHVIFSNFAIEELTANSLSAIAWSEEMTAREKEHATEIKAVTWHGLQLRETVDGWTAEIIFDT